MKATIVHIFNLRNGSAWAPADAVVPCALLTVVGMALSPFLLSVAMWGWVTIAFWQSSLDTPPGAGPSAWRVLVFSFRNLFRQPALAALALLLCIPVLSGLWSADHAYWLERVRVRLPFLVMPWAFANLPFLDARRLYAVLYLLVGVMALVCVGVLANFLLHRQEIMQAMYEGRPMPVPRNHIRFSLLVSTAVLAGWHLWRQRFVWRFGWERWVLGGSTLFLFGCVHFVAVRSGLIALYAALFFLGFHWSWQERRWAWMLLAPAVAGLVLWGAIQLLPTLHQKLGYALYDWQQYRQGKGASYSDSERWVSMQAGWRIWQAHRWLGVGAGDLPAAVQETVAAHFPQYRAAPKLPHNQFLYLLAGTGILGLFFSLYAFLRPVFAYRGGQAIFYAFQCMALVSFLVEYTIETAIGVAWYLFFTLWFLRLRGEESAPAAR
jgi:O-antigen ligase